jgi:1-pyrroline-5-carboxylate dehydrogenase
MRMTTTVPRTYEPFRNEPIRRFTDPAEVAATVAAIARFRGRMGGRIPLVIDGKPVDGTATIPSYDPAHPDVLVGDVVAADASQVDRALTVATERFAMWSRVPADERAAFLMKVAASVREHRDDWNAMLVVEVGKPYGEADADTAEAIDFLEYYAREMLRLADPAPLTPVAGEDNHLRYIGLGVGAVIPPWNFAFAIMAGMTAAAIVCGNTVVLKPSPDASVIAAAFVDLLHELGLPAGVVNFVPGDGPGTGESLVTDPRTRFISFTGSRAVGLRINELAAKTPPGQRWIKRVIAELGGKDAIVVAADADFDAAVDGVVASAFGFSGQKCSACSRAIVDASIYDRFVDAVASRANALRIGDPQEAGVEVGPVVNEKAVERILSYIALARNEARVAAGGTRLEREGYFIAPTVLADVDPRSRLAQEEIFGPVVAIIKAADFEDAIRIGNDTEYGLTGSVYATDEARLTRAVDELFVGNLYLNRKCTGALVGAHPFGGFNLSGTDSKAGGPDYLLLFTQAKSVSRRLT